MMSFALTVRQSYCVLLITCSGQNMLIHLPISYFLFLNLFFVSVIFQFSSRDERKKLHILTLWPLLKSFLSSWPAVLEQ